MTTRIITVEPTPAFGSGGGHEKKKEKKLAFGDQNLCELDLKFCS
jgi:hypothetical protein